MPEKQSIRNSGVELLRLIGMVTIFICHSAPLISEMPRTNGFLSFDIPANTIFNLFVYCGYFGNVIFSIIAAYYLCDSSRVKANKLLILIFNSFLISVIFLLGFVIAGYHLPTDVIVRQFFPTILSALHFITRYVVLYLFHPIINWFLKKIKYRGHLILTISIFSISTTINILLLYFKIWDITNSFFSMFLIYVLVSFFKHYSTIFSKNKKSAFLGFMSIGLLSLIPYIILCFYPNSICLQYLTVIFINYFSPLFFLACYALFMFFNQLKFQSKIINYVSSCSLISFCVHANYLFRVYFVPNFQRSFIVFDGGTFEILYSFAYCGMLFVFGYLTAIIYRETLNRLTTLAALKLSIPIENGARKAITKVQDFHKNHK